jgi:hypothetical protein
MMAAVAAAGALAVAGCGHDESGSEEDSAAASSVSAGLPQGSEPVKLDPADFTAHIDNPYFPLRPGEKAAYDEHEDGTHAHVEITVLNDTKKIEGITARVVHDAVSEDGELIEDTYDWYGQDADSNVWYLGEDTTELEHGKAVTKEGSWETGVKGAQPGVIMPADPRPGMTYRQEYYKGHAEDHGEILSVGEQVEVPYGHFKGAVLTKDVTPLEPRLVEYKLYAPDVGLALTLDVSGASGREALVRLRR